MSASEKQRFRQNYKHKFDILLKILPKTYLILSNHVLITSKVWLFSHLIGKIRKELDVERKFGNSRKFSPSSFIGVFPWCLLPDYTCLLFRWSSQPISCSSVPKNKENWKSTKNISRVFFWLWSNFFIEIFTYHLSLNSADDL